MIVAASFFVGKSQSKVAQTKTATSKDYPLLAQRIFVDEPNDPIVNFSGLRASMRKYMADNNISGSLYFEYLPTGTSIRVNGDSQDVGASLIKLPAAMELYKAVELGKIDLNQTITLKQEWLDSSFGNLYKRGAGYQLTLKQAVEIMLEDSDNTALNAVIESMKGMVPLDNAPFAFLDVDATQNQDQTISISPRSYSSFLKCLYFSCYVNTAHSQELLTMLTKSDFNDRLRAGISDKDVVVAHKIGNFKDQVQSDCGLVYVPKRQYVLCIMLDGPETAETSNHIATLSKMAYEFVKNQ